MLVSVNIAGFFTNIKLKVQNFFYYLSSKKKIVGGILGLLIITASLGAGVYLVQKRQSTKTQATGVELNLSPTNAGPQVGDTFVVTVGIKTNGSSVSAADLKIKFDSNLLEAAAIQAGDFLPNVLIPGKISNGTATIVVACRIDATGAYPKDGTGYLAQITFKAKVAGTSSITFDSVTAVAVVGQTTNAVGTMTPVQITTLGAATTPPTESPTISPTVSPSASASPTELPATPPAGSPGAKVGDVNGDTFVNLLDINEIVKHYGGSVTDFPLANLNGDDAINILDINVVIKHYGE